MSGLISNVQGSRGIKFQDPQIILVKNLSGGQRALGDLLMFDIALTHSLTLNYKEGNLNSAWYNCVMPSTLLDAARFMPTCICAEPIGSNQVGHAYLSGLGILVSVDGAALAGVQFTAKNGSAQADLNPAGAGPKAFGYILKASTGIGDIVPCIFDGFYGVGNG